MKRKEIERSILTVLDTLCLTIDSRNYNNLGTYLVGLLGTYVGSFSVLQMSKRFNCNYEKLQHLVGQSKINDNQLNTARLSWAKATGSIGETTDLVIDDTSIRKFRDYQDYVARGYIGNLGKVDKMMSAVFACFWSEGNLIPYDFKHYLSSKKLPLGVDDKSFKSKPQLAMELVKGAQETLSALDSHLGYILTDSAYSAGWFLNDLNSMSLPYHAAIKTNRTVVDEKGKKICSAKSLAPRLAEQKISYKKLQFIVSSSVVWLNKVDHKVKLFWTKNTKTGKERFFITNNLDMSNEEAVAKYFERTHIDSVFFKVAKGVLLLSQGKFQKLQSYTRHYYFVSLAFTILAYIARKEGITIFRVKELFNL